MKKSFMMKSGYMTKSGFTLIEMLVTLAIVTILAGVSLTGFVSYRQRSYFDDAVSQVHGEIQKTQSLSLAPSDKDAVSYTFTINKNTGFYNIIETKTDSSTSTIDSGTISGVTLVVSPSASDKVVFNVADNSMSNGVSPNTQWLLEIHDPNPQTKFTTKYVVVLPNGAVELN